MNNFLNSPVGSKMPILLPHKTSLSISPLSLGKMRYWNILDPSKSPSDRISTTQVSFTCRVTSGRWIITRTLVSPPSFFMIGFLPCSITAVSTMVFQTHSTSLLSGRSSITSVWPMDSPEKNWVSSPTTVTKLLWENAVSGYSSKSRSKFVLYIFTGSEGVAILNCSQNDYLVKFIARKYGTECDRVPRFKGRGHRNPGFLLPLSVDPVEY